MEFPTSGGDCRGSKHWTTFAPRLGFSYRLNEKTVIRAGAGQWFFDLRRELGWNTLLTIGYNGMSHAGCQCTTPTTTR